MIKLCPKQCICLCFTISTLNKTLSQHYPSSIFFLVPSLQWCRERIHVPKFHLDWKLSFGVNSMRNWFEKVSIFEVFLSVEIELNENRKVMSRYVNIDGFLMIFVNLKTLLKIQKLLNRVIFIWECFDVAMVNLWELIVT